MELILLIIIAIALAIDSFTVSLAEGMEIRKLKIKGAIKLALIFSMLDVIMVMIGWVIGAELDKLSAGVLPLVVFVLLSLVGVQIIYNSIKTKYEKKINQLEEMVVADFATSLDALVIGPSLFLIGIPLTTAMFIIGSATFLISITGMIIGKEFRHVFAKHIKLIGILAGIILIIIAISNFLK